MNCGTVSQKSSHARKKPPPPPPYLYGTVWVWLGLFHCFLKLPNEIWYFFFLSKLDMSTNSIILGRTSLPWIQPMGLEGGQFSTARLKKRWRLSQSLYLLTVNYVPLLILFFENRNVMCVVLRPWWLQNDVWTLLFMVGSKVMRSILVWVFLCCIAFPLCFFFYVCVCVCVCVVQMYGFELT